MNTSRQRIIIFLTAICLLGLGFGIGVFYQSTLTMSSQIDTLKTYTNDTFHFSLQYPYEFNQIEEAVGGVAFRIKDSQDLSGFGVTIEHTSFASTEEWLDAQAKGSATQGGYQPISILGYDQIYLVVHYEVVDHDGDTPIYGKIQQGVKVKNHQLFTINWHNQLPADQIPTFETSMVQVLTSFFVYELPNLDQANIDNAKLALINFFDTLRREQYAEAVKYYGSDYDQLRYWNPTIDRNDYTALWKNGCEMNGLHCLGIRNLALDNHPDDNTYVFNVWFTNTDGWSEFSVGPCCGGISTEPPQNMFKFTVTKSEDESFKVQTMPVYTP